MTNRLDASALIKLVGKEKVRQELDKNIWNYTIIDTNNYIAFVPKTISKRIEVPNGVTPLEHMFFNDSDFLRWIINNLWEDLSDLDDEIVAFIEGDSDELLTKQMQSLWETLLDAIVELPVDSLNSLFLDSIEKGVYAMIYDANMNVVFPTAKSKSKILAKKFIGVEEVV